MTERDSGSGTGSKIPPKPRIESWRPAPAPHPSRPPLSRRSRGRLTLDFSGPLLPLPDEAGPSNAPPLELDTSELLPELSAESREASVPLDLDLGGLDDALPPVDAWANDRRARGTLPPFEVVRPESISQSRESSKPPRTSAGLLSEHDGDALGLVDRSRPAAAEPDLATEMAERYALGDFTGSLRAAELILGQRANDPAAIQYARSSREQLERFYQSRIGPIDVVPQLALADRNIRWLGLDHRAAFLLSRVDGMHSIEELLDVSGMPKLETLKTLCELLDQKAIRLPDRG